MGRRLIAALVAGVSVLESPSALADSGSDGRVGQYYCVVEYAAGIVESGDDKTLAGKVDIPDSDKKFFGSDQADGAGPDRQRTLYRDRK